MTFRAVVSLGLVWLVASCASSPTPEPEPAAAEPVRKPPAVVRQVLKLRVYADASHRTRDPAWDQHIREIVEEANALLATQFAARLEVSNTRVWERSGGDALDAALQELQARDAGDDTSWIVGLVGTRREPTNDVHQLGTSVTLGRHMVLRATSADKALSVFLHHVGHTLGAPHSRDPSVMSPTYDPRFVDLGPLTKRVFALGLAYRDQLFDNTAVTDWHVRLNQLLTRDSVFADVQDLARVRDILEHPWRNRQAGTPATKSDAFDNLTKETFEIAERYVSTGALNKAWTLANAMIEKHPDNSRLLDFGCSVRASLAIGTPGVKKPLTEERELCARAADASVWQTSEVFLARLDALAGNADDALHGAREADAKLTGPAGGKPVASEQTKTAWTNLASLYAQLGCMVSAQRAADLAGGDAVTAIASWSQVARREQGTPPAGLDASNDCEYAAMLRDARDELAVGRLREARKVVDSGLAKYPGSAGFMVISCELEARQGHTSQARDRCNKALAVDGEVIRGHQLLGYLEARSGNLPTAIAHLSRVVELDPDLESAWTDLGKLYVNAKAESQAHALAAAFQQRFGKPMPGR